METESVTISLRIPKALNADLEKYAKLGNYASKTELLREAIRATLYESIGTMKGALKAKSRSLTTSQWRASEWKKALKNCGGDAKKAALMLEEKEKKAVSSLKF
ncbi:MAG: ribbon-helix-helix domain-containing protein [Candidatus Micrarchaeia archaeon]